MSNYMETILTEIQDVLRFVEETTIAKVGKVLSESGRIFVAGEGRSGLMAKSFAMRLMHLGAEVFVIGETITPAIKKGDTLIVVSGSGTSKSVVWAAEKAKELDCFVIAFTTNLESKLVSFATLPVHIPASTKYRREGEMESIQPLGSLFDQCAHIIFDSVCLCYGKQKDIEHSTAFQLHSNLE
ncbi:6-phospho-3-hexuloisomerase [Bacillus sp. AL-1R]